LERASARILEHDPEKWTPVSRLREALSPVCRSGWCFGGQRQVGKDHAQTMTESKIFGVSALPPKADIVQHGGNVRFVPEEADISRLIPCGKCARRQKPAYFARN
jgi:hypothetical protein